MGRFPQMAAGYGGNMADDGTTQNLVGNVTTSTSLPVDTLVDSLECEDSASNSLFDLGGGTDQEAADQNDGVTRGQVKTVILAVQPSTGDAVLTPDNFLSGTTITFDAVGEYAVLQDTPQGWIVLETTATVA